MERSELIELIEGPILKAYSSGKRKYTKDSKSADMKIEADGYELEAEVEGQGTHRTHMTNRTHSSSSGSFNNSIILSEAQRDRRTVFVQQLSVRCTDRDLFDFFTENDCPVRHARIVLDKYTRKSKGVAYVEFYEEETVKAALKLTGKKVVGVPVIVELTETEKNRIAQEAAAINAAASSGISANNKTATSTSTSAAASDDLVRLYVGSLHPSLTEQELEQLFEPFGILESVELLRDEKTGTSKGVAFIQYQKVGAARNALEALNGFELAGRAIRIGPVRLTDKSKSSSQSTASKSTKPALPSQQQQQQKNNGEVDEEENITLDAKKRAELMQKLLSSRK